MKAEGVTESVNRKRDNIIKNARTETLPPQYEEAAKIMEDHLKANKRRCTIERRYVLEMLYRYTTPVDISTLHEAICETMGNVSLTTVYNTLDLLVELKLAHRIDLVSHGMAFFERTLGVEPHGYVVCEQCGSIKPLKLPRLMEEVGPMLPAGYTPQGYTLLIHGLCSACQRNRHKRRKTAPKKTTNDLKQTK